jgi:DNA-binding MarR family transcriptional regulator
MAREETTVAQAEVFFALILLTGKDEKDVRQEDLGNRLGRPQGVISGQLAKFVNAKLLEKNISTESEREKTYRLTPSGKALVHKVQKALEG